MFVNVKSVNKALQTRKTMLNHVFLNRRFGTNILVAPTVKLIKMLSVFPSLCRRKENNKVIRRLHRFLLKNTVEKL